MHLGRPPTSGAWAVSSPLNGGCNSRATHRRKRLETRKPKKNYKEVRKMTSVIKDLIYKIEGFNEVPNYEIESIARTKDGRIEIVIRENAAATERTQGEGDGQAEQRAAE